MKRRVFIFWAIFTAAAIFRVGQSLYARAPDIGDCVKNIVRGTGTISAEPERKEKSQSLVISTDVLAVASTSASCGLSIFVQVGTKIYPQYSYGDRVSFSGRLNKPFNFASDTGRSFDYEGYLAKDDIYYQIKSAQVQTAAATDAGFPGTNSKAGSVGGLFALITSWLFILKKNFVNNLNRVLGEPHSALAAGLVVGEKSALGAKLIDDFRTVGLIHIVVLSGFNITVVADSTRRLLSFLPRVWGIVIGALGIVLFGILVGGGATVVRSCAMAGIALSADFIRRDYSVVRALALSALVMLIQNPMILLHDPSFQLSFLATLGLILLASPIEKRLTLIPEKFGMRGIVASTIATQIFVSPYILYMMGQISLIGMVVNILVLPFIPVTMLFVFLTGAIGMISYPASIVVGWGAHILLAYELFMVENFARLPFASLHVPAFSFVWVVVFYATFLTFFFLRGRLVQVYALARLKFSSITSQFKFAKKSST